MAVGIHGDKLVLLYSPSFLDKLSFHMACFVVKHEALHIMLDHIPRWLELLAQFPTQADRTKAQTRWNIAADLAINCLLRKDPEWWRVRDEFTGELPEPWNLPADQSFDFYLDALMKRPDDDEQFAKPKLVTTHQHWEPKLDDVPPTKTRKKRQQADVESAPVNPDELNGLTAQVRAQAKNIIKNAMTDMQKLGGRGFRLPHGLQQWLDDYLAEPVVPWWDLLTTRIHAARRTKPVRSIQRPNRMLLALSEEDPTILPAIGTSYDPAFRVFKVIDVSGSMSDEMVNIGLTETQALMRVDEDIEVRVMQGDDEIVSDQLYRGLDDLPRNRDAQGGTDFNAYFEYIWRHHMGDPNLQPDLVVIYTDGGTSRSLTHELRLPPDIPVIWLMSPDGHGRALEQEGYGEVIWAHRDQSRDYEG
jgi:predicted metal-dependent peptidase